MGNGTIKQVADILIDLKDNPEKIGEVIDVVDAKIKEFQDSCHELVDEIKEKLK